MIDKKKLTLIHIEAGSALLPKMEEPNTAIKVVATYLAPPAILRKARTDESVLEPWIQQAEELDGDAAQEVLVDFFGQWSGYQASILSCVAMDLDKMAAVVDRVAKMKVGSMATRASQETHVVSERTSETDDIPD